MTLIDQLTRTISNDESTPRTPDSSSPAPGAIGAGMDRPQDVVEWVDELAALMEPGDIHWVDGSARERHALLQGLVASGTIQQLNPDLRPYSFLARSDASDVARIESRTFICSVEEDDAGPTNNWRDPVEMRAELSELFAGSMRGRTLYVVPFAMGPLGSPMTKYGVQVTDSPYVVVSMGTMTRMGDAARATTRSTSCTTPRRERSGRSARPTVVTRSCRRRRSRCASPRSSLEMRDGSPSTCCSSR